MNIQCTEVTSGASVGLDQAATLINIRSKLKSSLSAQQLPHSGHHAVS